MPTRDEIDDYREFERNHPGKWWEHFRRLRRFIDNRSVAVTYCEAGFEIIPLLPSTSPRRSPARMSGQPRARRVQGRVRAEGSRLPRRKLRRRVGRRALDAPDPTTGSASGRGWAVACSTSTHATVASRPWPHWSASTVSCPRPLTVMSGRGDGGHHRWFDNVPGPLRKQLCPGVDILCRERNFVVVPPSRHRINDQPYTFKNPAADIVDAPAWLVELATRPEPPPRPPRPRWPRGWRLSAAQTLRRCRGLVDTVTNAVEGERRNVLFWAACRAAEDGLLIEEDDPVWTELAEAADTTGLDRDEIHQALRGAIAIADTPQCPRSGLRSTEGPVRLRETGPVRLRGTARRSTS